MCSAVFCAVLPYGAAARLDRTVIVAGVLACGFAVNKRADSAWRSNAARQLAEAEKAAEKAARD